MKRNPFVFVLGLVLFLAGVFGLIICSLAVYYGITDKEEMELSVRIGAIGIILLLDVICFVVAWFGWNFLREPSRRPDKKPDDPQCAVKPESEDVLSLRCQECGARVQGEKGQRIQCPCCGKRFTVSLSVK